LIWQAVFINFLQKKSIKNAAESGKKRGGHFAASPQEKKKKNLRKKKMPQLRHKKRILDNYDIIFVFFIVD